MGPERSSDIPNRARPGGRDGGKREVSGQVTCRFRMSESQAAIAASQSCYRKGGFQSGGHVNKLYYRTDCLTNLGIAREGRGNGSGARELVGQPSHHELFFMYSRESSFGSSPFSR